MGFKDWLLSDKTTVEAMTSTSSIASFPRIAIPLIYRTWPPSFGDELKPTDWDSKKKKKKKYKVPQVDD